MHSVHYIRLYTVCHTYQILIRTSRTSKTNTVLSDLYTCRSIYFQFHCIWYTPKGFISKTNWLFKLLKSSSSYSNRQTRALWVEEHTSRAALKRGSSKQCSKNTKKLLKSILLLKDALGSKTGKSMVRKMNCESIFCH